MRSDIEVIGVFVFSLARYVEEVDVSEIQMVEGVVKEIESVLKTILIQESE
ncbi:MAG: hypothetical protein Q9M91_01475 [Candidatus Dojkabacteria bacterium]|nr:hypothetical protein [Candidatus Dojkabacteria bacterium]